MKFTYLGTAAAEGIPALFCECDICRYAAKKGGRNLRARSSALIDDSILIDFSPDMLTVKMRYHLNLAAAQAVFFTYSHIDHLASKELCYYHGMYSNRVNPSSVLHLYGNEKVLDTIRKDFIFDMETLPDCVVLHRMEPFRPVTIGHTTVTALPARHDPREECLIYLIEQLGARLLYANDTTMPPEETLNFLRGKRLDVASLDCTTGRFPCNTVHMGFPDNLVLRRRLIDLGAADEGTQFISHHFSHNGRVNFDDFAELAAGSGFVSSYDGMEIRL